VEEAVCNRIVNMLVFAEPHVFAFLGEPEMNEGLIVNVNIDFITIREAVVGVVLVAPPFAGEAKYD
jgi:hypothetical protein